MKLSLRATILTYIIFNLISAEAKKHKDETKVNDIEVESVNIKPNIDDVKRFAWYSAASVCTDDVLNPWICKACRQVNNTVPFVQLFEIKSLTIKAYIATDDEKKEIIVSFRGGVGIRNALTFLDRKFTTFNPYVLDKKIRVHNGFKGTMEALCNKFMKPLASMLSGQYSSYKVVVTGHSFGGAMASIAVTKIKFDLDLDWSRMSLYTYGQLRVGNREFALWYATLPLVVARGVNFNDPAPHKFYKEANDFYAHHQNEIFINSTDASTYSYCNTSLLEDPNCSNSIDPDTYSLASHIAFFDTDFSKEGAC